MCDWKYTYRPMGNGGGEPKRPGNTQVRCGSDVDEATTKWGSSPDGKKKIQYIY